MIKKYEEIIQTHQSCLLVKSWMNSHFWFWPLFNVHQSILLLCSCKCTSHIRTNPRNSLWILKPSSLVKSRPKILVPAVDCKDELPSTSTPMAFSWSIFPEALNHVELEESLSSKSQFLSADFVPSRNQSKVPDSWKPFPILSLAVVLIISRWKWERAAASAPVACQKNL